MTPPDEHPAGNSRATGKFYYDGGCGLCRWVVKWLSRMDFGSGITWISFQSLERPPDGLTWGDLDRAAYLETGQGDLLEGFYAFRKLTRKVPALWLLAPLFCLPGIHVPGRVVYRWVAANRYKLSRCPIPDRQRSAGGTSAARPRDDCQAR
ncbi:MAG TPA: DUF393 domain-containing protein [Dehalococcoidia bacterium]|nr:DUF393 domain-containing protein [Dehalococcoidia bacterium]